MVWTPACKLLQRKTISVLSHKYGILCVIAGCVLVFVSAFQFGEVALEWSKENYAAVFNSFSDNIAGQSFRKRLCLPVPIDIVYTWVNGTDPKLLADLRRYKIQLEQELRNVSSFGECTFNDCVNATMVVLQPSLPPGVTIAELIPENAIFSQTVQNYQLEFTISNHHSENVTVIVFDSATEVATALQKQKLHVHGHNFTVRKAYYTSDWVLPNSKTLRDQILITGLPSGYDEDTVKKLFPAELMTSLTKIEVHEESGVAVLRMTDCDEAEKLQHSNVTIGGKAVTITLANLVWDLHDYNHNDDISASRFEDNEELRYSLRSVERFAPWVRHVFIVTNGQIPSWLNLDSPRITVVTHQDFFVNKSHLPTFGSPAIESHLHRIPGLSDKFIYMNDDVMFGKEVWPDDFYTHASGQKVYLTWPVPSCREGCPSTWIRDGYCDKACNNSDCDWDGGDCEGKTGTNVFGAHPHLGDYYSYTGKEYCSTGCANNWVADRYCDPSCNVKDCGFDAGDCGSSSFHELPMLTLHSETTHYTLQQGATVVYFNVTSLFDKTGVVSDSYYETNNVIRMVAIAQKLKVMTLILFPKHNATTLQFCLEGKDGKEKKLLFNFTVSVDTRRLRKPATNDSIAIPLLEDKSARKLSILTTRKPFGFENIPQEKLSAKPKIVSEEIMRSFQLLDMRQYLLPNDTERELGSLIQQLNNGDMTRKGFVLAQAQLWQEYVLHLRRDGKEPVRAPPRHDILSLGPFVKGNINQKHRLKDEKSGDTHKKAELKDSERQQVDKNVQVQKQESKEPALLKDAAHVKLRHSNVASERLVRKEGPGNMDVVVPEHSGKHLPKHVIRQTDDRGKKSIVGGGVGSKGEQGGSNKTALFKTRGLMGIEGEEKTGFLPWEEQGIFDSLQKKWDATQKQREYSDTVVPHRRLLDTYADSLRHVNHLYNVAFGYTARKVPAHMPHFIDRNIMAELQARFPREWDITSSHKIRSSKDMQFAFSYFYYLMGQIQNVTASDVFVEMDTDHSGVLSDREIRTLATRLYELPLDLQTLTNFESLFMNCSKHQDTQANIPPASVKEVYYDKNMPQVTKHLFTSCEPLVSAMKTTFSSRNKYKFELLTDDEVVFKMLQNNSSHIVGQLDDIRKHPKKFICLNDNIAHGSKESATVKAVLRDFYESLFPIPSTFELPHHYRNRFQYVDDVQAWRHYLEKMKRWTSTALGILIVFTIISFFSSKIESLWKKLFGRRLQGMPAKKQRTGRSKNPPGFSLMSV